MQAARSDELDRDILALAVTRRRLLRGALLGMTGLAGCGNDTTDENPIVPGKGAGEVGKTPGIGNETGIGTGGGSGQGETEEAATPGS